MKNRITLVAGMLLVCLLPMVADTLPWRSTSTMQDINKDFTPSVTAVEAQRAERIPMHSTSTMMETGHIPTPELADQAELMSGPRKAFDTGGESGQSEEFPVGEPWVLIVFAAAGAGVIAWRRRGVRSTIDNNAKG